MQNSTELHRALTSIQVTIFNINYKKNAPDIITALVAEWENPQNIFLILQTSLSRRVEVIQPHIVVRCQQSFSPTVYTCWCFCTYYQW